MKKLYMPVFYRFMKLDGHLGPLKLFSQNWDFWDRPENARCSNEKLVRLFFYMIVKILLGKDSILDYKIVDVKIDTQVYFKEMLLRLDGCP
jgi:hypothetical protein